MPGAGAWRQPEKAGIYEPEDVHGSIATLEEKFFYHAVVTWVLLPLWVLINASIAAVAFVCTAGFHDVALVVLGIVEVHHVYAESCAWSAVKSLLAPLEVCVLRQLGVLRKRKFLVLQGILEMLDLYTDLVFPFLARACMEEHGDVTQLWRSAWREVPITGIFIDRIIKRLSFWGCSLILVTGKVLLVGGTGLLQMQHHVHQRQAVLPDILRDTPPLQRCCPRISGEVFLAWGNSARTAIMPSVEYICEEIALQRQYKLDLRGHGGSKDVRTAMEARIKSAYGKTTPDMAAQLEIQDITEQEHIKEVGFFLKVLMLVVKVLVGNVLQLWLQSSFFALAFDAMGTKAKAKVLASMVLSVAVGVLHLHDGAARGGPCGRVLAFIILVALLLVCAKVFYAFQCRGHVWNFTTGCVEL